MTVTSDDQLDPTEAVQMARDWVAVRKTVRTHLIALARAAHPHPVVDSPRGTWESSDVRKLYQFPSDLSDERLLKLVEA